MTCSLIDLLTKNRESVESRQLFDSYRSSIAEFENCFFNMFLFDYSVVFGDEPKNRFMYNLLKEFYHNDFFVRYSFINNVLSKSEAVSFEEFPVGNSRVDLASINDKSIAYEIKSDYDNYDKLEKQIKEYSRFFEYIYVICPKSRIGLIEKHLPYYCGIYTYTGTRDITFKKSRRARHSPNISFEQMILSLRKVDLKKAFSTDNPVDIINSCSKQKINNTYKSILKVRFKSKWELLKEEACSLN